MAGMNVFFSSGESKRGFVLPCMQIIMAILVSWLLCFIFTVTDVFPPEENKYGFYARTDARQGILKAAPWFKIPYPCEFLQDREKERVTNFLYRV